MGVEDKPLYEELPEEYEELNAEDFEAEITMYEMLAAYVPEGDASVIVDLLDTFIDACKTFRGAHMSNHEIYEIVLQPSQEEYKRLVSKLSEHLTAIKLEDTTFYVRVGTNNFILAISDGRTLKLYIAVKMDEAEPVDEDVNPA